MWVKCLRCNESTYLCDCQADNKSHQIDGVVNEPKPLQWQSGVPPTNGWYWILAGDKEIVMYYDTSDFYHWLSYWRNRPWAGPLEPPKEVE